MTKRDEKRILVTIFGITLVMILVIFLVPKGEVYECSKPYIRYYQNYCCIDKNSNGICDFTERLISIECTDACVSDSCNDFNYVKCFNGTFGCNREVDIGKIKGECGVNCFNDGDCSKKEYCDEHSCYLEKLRCRQYCELGAEIVEQKLIDRDFRFTVQNNNKNTTIGCFTFVESKIDEQHKIYRLVPDALREFRLNVPINDTIHLACSAADTNNNLIGEKQIFLYAPDN